MQSISFNSTLPLTIFHVFAGGGGQPGGSTPGLVTFTIGDADSWLVYDDGALSASNIPTLVDDLNTYAAPALQLTRAGADLAPLPGAVHLDTLALRGPWTSADLSGFPGLLQLEHLSLHETQVDDGGLTYIGTHHNLERLTLSSTLVNGSSLADLAGLTQLRELIIFKTAFSDGGCALLSNVPSVRMLNLLETAITDVGITNIRTAIPDILTLFIDRNAGVTDACIPDLVAMVNLSTLSLESTSITNAGIVSVLALPELIHLDVKNLSVDDPTCSEIVADRTNWQVLNFANTTMTNAALNGFSTQQALTVLGLRCSGVNSGGIASLSACTGLVDLDLSVCVLDDSALLHLYELSNLRSLNVVNTGGSITHAGIDALIAAIPGLKVESDFS